MRPNSGRISSHIKSHKLNVTNLILEMRSCCSRIIVGSTKCHVLNEICQSTFEEMTNLNKGILNLQINL